MKTRIGRILKISLSLSLSLCGYWSQAQVSNKYQINLILSPTLETYTAKTEADGRLFQPKLSYNFGAEYKLFLDPEFSASAGLLFQDKGFRSTFSFDTNDSTKIGDGLVAVSTMYLTLPIEFGNHWQIARKTEFFLNYGIDFGYLIKQSFLGKRIPDDLGEEVQFLDQNITENRTDVEWFNKGFFGAHVGVGIQQYIASRLVLVIEPAYMYQFNRTIDPDGPLVTPSVDFNPKFNSFILHLKLGWYFNKQIQNEKKQI